MKIDFHVHSIGSDDGTASLEEIAAKAKTQGLDGVFICDHNKISLDKPVNIAGVWLLPGCEISCKNAHILALMFDRKLEVPEYSKTNLPEVSDMVNRIHEAGGLAVIAHPYAHPTAKGWDPRDLEVQPDGCEVFNARGWMRNPECNALAKAYAEELELFMTGGSDGHLADELGHAYAEVDCETPAGIKEALLGRKTSPVLIENTKRIYKGRSQMQKAKRSKKPGLIIKGVARIAKCLVLDALGK